MSENAFSQDPVYRVPQGIRVYAIGDVHGHGHSIYAAPENKPHRISVDTGACKGGPLSCAVLEDSDVRFLQVR